MKNFNRLGKLFSISACLLIVSGCAAPKSPTVNSEQSSIGSSEDSFEPSQDVVEPHTTISVPDVGAQNPVCENVDWSPVESLLAQHSAQVIEYRTSELSSIEPWEWVTKDHTPSGQVRAGHCAIDLSTLGDPQYSFSEVTITVWLFGESPDSEGFFKAWQDHGTIPGDAQEVSIAGATTALTSKSSTMRNTPEVWARAGNYMLLIGLRGGSPNAERNGAMDPDHGQLMDSFSQVLGDIFSKV